MCKTKTKVIVVEPHPDDALGSASGICFSSKIETIVLTITKTKHEKSDYRDKIKLNQLNCDNLQINKLNVLEHLNAGFEDLHWDERIQEPVSSYDEIFLKYRELYGIKNYINLCNVLKEFFLNTKEQNSSDEFYISIPLGVLHPMHVITTNACIEAVISCGISSNQIIFYIDHPYDLFDKNRVQTSLARAYISEKSGVELTYVDDVSVDTIQVGKIIKDIYTEKHYGEFNGAFNKTMCSYLIANDKLERIKELLKIKINNIVVVATEAMPVYKTGGLGEVIYQLAKGLVGKVNNICIMLPKNNDININTLNCIKKNKFTYRHSNGNAELMGLEVYFYDELKYYVIDIGCHIDSGEKFALFCDVVLQKGILFLDFIPNIIHCNDWQTGLIPCLHKFKYIEKYPYNNIRTIYTIHASCYKGVFPKSDFFYNLITHESHKLFTNYKLNLIDYLTERQAKELNVIPSLLCLQRIGVNFADTVSTVSKGHAEELKSYPEFSSIVIKGIRNGISGNRHVFEQNSGFYNIDESIMFSQGKDIEKLKKRMICQYKLQNKTALQKLCGFEINNNKLFICMVSRLTDVKGYDYLQRIFDLLVQLPIQMLIVGDGDVNNPSYKDFWEAKTKQYPDIILYKEYDKELEYKSYAGSDVLLMPSIKESCGIAQMKAMIHGTIPIVTKLGCFKDSIVQYGLPLEDDKGIGFYSFLDSYSILEVIIYAINIYQHNRKEWIKMIISCFCTDFSWENGVLKEYLNLYGSC